MHNFFSTFNILFDTTDIRIMLLFNLLLQIYWISTRFSLFASFSVSYFMMLGFNKTLGFFSFCLILPLVNVGWYLHWMRDDHDGDSVPPSAILSDCWATWSETTVGRSSWIFLKCQTRSFLFILSFSIFTIHLLYALYINKCYKIKLSNKLFCWYD